MWRCKRDSDDPLGNPSFLAGNADLVESADLGKGELELELFRLEGGELLVQAAEG